MTMEAAPPTENPDIDAEIGRLESLTRLMDDGLRVPGTSIRFGLDPILGLVPGVGDFAGVGAAAYMILKAGRLGVPKRIRLRMAVNTGLDFLVGTIPVLGDLFDVAFKANRRNLDLIRRHAPQAGGRRDSDLSPSR